MSRDMLSPRWLAVLLSLGAAACEAVPAHEEPRRASLHELLGPRVQDGATPAVLPFEAVQLEPSDEALAPWFLLKAGGGFGPFLISGGPELLGKRVYYRDYLTAHPRSAVFAKYYKPQVPSDAGIVTVPVPGTEDGGIDSVAFDLRRVRASSRYGGSVELLFTMKESIGLELVDGPRSWDVDDLRLYVHVTPVARAFTVQPTLSSLPEQKPIHVELEASGVVGYVEDGSDLVPTEGTEQALQDHLELVAAGYESSPDFTKQVRRFAHAFVDIQSPNAPTDQTEEVVAIHIDDDDLELVTSTTEPYISLLFRVNDVRADTELGDEELYVFVSTELVGLGPKPSSIRVADIGPLDSGGSSAFHTLARHPEDAWNSFDELIYGLSVTERDGDVSAPESFEIVWGSLSMSPGEPTEFIAILEGPVEASLAYEFWVRRLYL